MKKIFIAILLIGVQACFLAASAKNNDVLDASEELEKLKQQKHAIDLNSKTQVAACYQKFAVSNCLQEVKATTQTSLNSIKRRELEIKDSQRNAKIQTDEIKQIGSKNDVVPKAGEAANLKSTTAKTRQIKSIKTDGEILADKTISDKLRAEQAKRRLDDSNRKQAQLQRKNQIRENKNNQSADNVAKYNQKMALAAAKKAAVEEESLLREQPKSASLPIPKTISSIPTPTAKTQ